MTTTRYIPIVWDESKMMYEAKCPVCGETVVSITAEVAYRADITIHTKGAIHLCSKEGDCSWILSTL